MFRDWIGIPATTATLFIAFFGTAQVTILKWMSWDGATISTKLIDVDIINIGLDDQPLVKQVEKVTKYAGFVRFQLINEGRSLASFRPNFYCTGPQLKQEERTVYTFNFYDLQKAAKLYPEVAPGTAPSFFARLGSATPIPSLSTDGPKRCSFPYFDKYGSSRKNLELTDVQIELLGSAIPKDEGAEWRERYCAGWVTLIDLTSNITAECVNDTHIVAVDSSYNFVDAISRAFSYSRLLTDLTNSQAQRMPGVILVCNPRYSNCNEDREQAIKGYALLGLSSTAWFRNSKSAALSDCERINFPQQNQP